jgi:hypothetical protein
MKNAVRLLVVGCILTPCVASAKTQGAKAITVNCDKGETISGALSALDPQTPQHILVTGTCAEYVAIVGFVGLTLEGAAGSALNQPDDPPPAGPPAVLRVSASHSVTIRSLNVTAGPDGNTAAVSVGESSTDVRLRNMTITGGEVLVYSQSQVSLAGLAIRDSSTWVLFSMWDQSSAHMEDCLLETSAGTWQGIAVGNSVLVLHGTTIRNLPVAIGVSGGADLIINDFSNYFPMGGVTDVVVENAGGGSFWGVAVEGTSSVVVQTKLRIRNPGQPWGGETGGVLVRGGSSFGSSLGSLEISGSQGQGVFVKDNSHASLSAPTITDTQRNAVVVANNSSVTFTSEEPASIVRSAGLDLFCDSTSLISGRASAATTGSIQCTRLIDGQYETPPLW